MHKRRDKEQSNILYHKIAREIKRNLELFRKVSAEAKRAKTIN